VNRIKTTIGKEQVYSLQERDAAEIVSYEEEVHKT
jgi:hypothetical protein